MIKSPNKKLAFITGASSGIGKAFSIRLASENYDLIVTARKEAKLQELAATLREKYHITVETIVADLVQDTDVMKLEQRIQKLPHLDLLINNAGFGTKSSFAAANIDRQIDMVKVHIIASMRLTKAALPGMIQQQRGAIINVSSSISYIVQENNVVYTASKSFLIPFSEVLQKELRHTGVKVQALCPGLTRTDFFNTSEYNNPNFFTQMPASLCAEPEDVVTASLAALKSNKVVVFPGWKNRLYMYKIKLLNLLKL